MDKKIVNRFSKYYKASGLQKAIGERLIILADNNFHNILEIGCGDGQFTGLLKEKFASSKITSLDISEKMVNLAKKKLTRINFIVADGEMLPFKERFDLIVSNASFQWFDDFNGSLVKYKDNLSENGLLLFSIFGRNTLPELTKSIKELFKIDIKIKASFFPSKEKIEEILKKNFKNIFLKKENIKKEYSSIMELLASIRYSSGICKNTLWTKGMIEKLDKIYRNKFNSIFATYEVFLCKAY